MCHTVSGEEYQTVKSLQQQRQRWQWPTADKKPYSIRSSFCPQFLQLKKPLIIYIEILIIHKTENASYRNLKV